MSSRFRTTAPFSAVRESFQGHFPSFKPSNLPGRSMGITFCIILLYSLPGVKAGGGNKCKFFFSAFAPDPRYVRRKRRRNPYSKKDAPENAPFCGYPVLWDVPPRCVYSRAIPDILNLGKGNKVLPSAFAVSAAGSPLSNEASLRPAAVFFCPDRFGTNFRGSQERVSCSPKSSAAGSAPAAGSVLVR